MMRGVQMVFLALLVATLAGPLPAAAQDPTASSAPASQEPYEPRIGQAGKDVVWVPTPPALLDLMLDMAQVTKDDFVMDLGSGDGRNIIAAARRGARGVGIEFNPDMVALSTRKAQEAGVGDKATFRRGDMYEADISKATVMAVFLLPANMEKLLATFQTLAPGSRIVSNTFGFSDWDPDQRGTVKDGACADWCEALLWIVPAQAAGTWAHDVGTLKLTQLHQVLYGSLNTEMGDLPISKARMRGYDISFIVGADTYSGRLSGNAMRGTVTGPAGTRNWLATRTPH